MEWECIRVQLRGGWIVDFYIHTVLILGMVGSTFERRGQHIHETTSDTHNTNDTNQVYAACSSSSDYQCVCECVCVCVCACACVCVC